MKSSPLPPFSNVPLAPGVGRLIVVSAPSGAGKTTLCQSLLRDFECLTLSISSTTRAPRGDEKDGIAYHFLTQEAFEAKIAQGDFAEWARVHDRLYGTDRQVIEAAFQRSRSVLLDIDVQGAASLKSAFPDRTHDFFIAPPSLAVLEQRLRGRGTESEDSIQRRIRNARAEMDRAAEFKVRIVNDDFTTAYAELKAQVALALGFTSATQGPTNG
jgi:guanylate kinase